MNEIIGFYYPQFKKIKIIKNFCRNKNVKVYSNDKTKEYEAEQITKIYEKAQQISIEKLSILNIVYELSRI